MDQKLGFTERAAPFVGARFGFALAPQGSLKLKLRDQYEQIDRWMGEIKISEQIEDEDDPERDFWQKPVADQLVDTLDGDEAGCQKRAHPGE